MWGTSRCTLHLGGTRDCALQSGGGHYLDSLPAGCVQYLGKVLGWVLSQGGAIALALQLGGSVGCAPALPKVSVQVPCLRQTRSRS